MAERSGFGNFLLIVIAVILGLGFYWTINAIDLLRQRQESLVQEVRGVGSQVRRLTEAAESGSLSLGPIVSQTAPAGPRTGPASKTTPTEPAGPRFANLELRDPKGVEGDAIVTAARVETGNMNYIINNENECATYWAMCNDSLAERNYLNPDVFEPKLAEAWEISDDKLTYAIHLRKGVHWHDFTDPTTGERFENVEVTANDFKFFLDVVRNPGIPCDALRVYLDDLDRIEIVDDYTFKVIWKKPYFLSREWSLGLSPLPRHFYRFDPAKPDDFTENTERNRMIVGCGHWIFDHWDKGSEVAFRRNEDYYGPQPYVKRVVYKLIMEPNARLQALKSGEVDLYDYLQQEQWISDCATPEFEARFNKFQYRDHVYYYIGYNLRRDIFADRLTRVALTHLVDRPRILNEVYHGLGVITTGPFYVESSSYDKSIVPYPFDIEKGKALLAEAGWKDADGDGVIERNGKPFEFTFLVTSSSKNFARISEIVREDFAKAGIVVNINPVEWSIYLERIEQWDFDMCGLGWSMGWEQDPYQLWHSSQAVIKKSSNHIGFKNEEVDRILEQARGEFDVEKRIALYHRFDQILHEEQPYTFLITPDMLIAQDKRYRNAKVYPLGMDPNSFWVPADEQKYRY
jgi:peptide/nickel transport system substrate-binding protein